MNEIIRVVNAIDNWWLRRKDMKVPTDDRKFHVTKQPKSILLRLDDSFVQIPIVGYRGAQAMIHTKDYKALSDMAVGHRKTFIVQDTYKTRPDRVYEVEITITRTR